MSRIRTIKPDLWTHGAFTECSLNARLLYIGSLNFCDDYGNLDRSANQLKARVFPCDNLDCEALIRDLLIHGRFIEYSVNGQKYLHIHKFADHQVVNRPGKPQFPAFDDSLRTHGTLTEDSVSVHGAINEDSGRTHGGMEGMEGRSRRKTPKAPEIYGLAELTDAGAPEQAAADWIKIRKSKRAPITLTVLRGIEAEAEKAGITFGEAIKVAAERTWQTFRADWFLKDKLAEKKPSREYDPSKLII